MKKLFKTTFLAALLVCSQIGIAQTVLVVDPGVGTLNTAIATYKGDRIYQLKANEWYGLNAPIENVDYHLQIIGAEPAVKGGMPATLQTGSSAGGAVFGTMFDAKGDITLKNIYLVNADLSSQVGAIVVKQSRANARVSVDRCVLHPVGVNAAVQAIGGNNRIYFTNNLAINHGHQVSPNDGHVFQGTHATIGLDSLWVENNTFVAMGTNMFHGNKAALTNNVICFNHNTIVMNKSQLDWSSYKMEEYWTNNLLFDVNTQPWSASWPGGGADKDHPKPNLIYADTLKNEVLPSTRPNIVEYNLHYRAQGFYDNIAEFNAFSKALAKPLPPVFLFPLVWPSDSVMCREALMFNSTGFPLFKYGNELTDVDPQWTDSKIYDHEANLIAWTRPASYIHALSQPAANYPVASSWPKFWWIPSGDISLNDVWPVFDGTYKNPLALKGAIEMNVPLGDLNWYPEAKAAWQNKKAMIWAHIKSGNTSKIDIGYGPAGTKNVNVENDLIYPSPAKDIIYVKAGVNSDVSILSMDGRILMKESNISKMNVSQLILLLDFEIIT